MIRRNPDIFAIAMLLLCAGLFAAGQRAAEFAIAFSERGDVFLQRVSRHADMADRIGEAVERKVTERLARLERIAQ